MSKKQVTQPTIIGNQPGNQPGTKPGSYIASPQLDRANTFATMAAGLEPALLDRSATITLVREAVTGYGAEFEPHRRDLLTVAQGVEEGTRKPRDLEALVEDKVAFYRSAERATLTTAARLPDESQIHAAAQAERFRVANNPNFWRDQ